PAIASNRLRSGAPTPRSRRAAFRRSNCAGVPNSGITGLLAADRTDRTAASSLAVASATPGLIVTISSLRSASGRYPSPASTDFFARGGIGGLRDVVGFARLGFFGIASSSRRLTTPDPPPRVAPGY